MNYGPTKSFSNVVEDIEIERKKQDAKWGVQNHTPLMWSAILGEECGEVCKASLDLERLVESYMDSEENFNNLKKATIHLREELIQVAAVAIAAIECIDRNMD